MQIDSLLIDADILTIISELKAQLAAQNIHLFAKMFDSGDDIMVCCPYHKNGQERRPSAGIRKSDGLFHCLACGETHSLSEVINHCFNETNTFGYKWLAKNFSSVEVKTRGAITLDISRTTTRNDSRIYIPEEELDRYRYTHKYLYERGLTDDIIDKFDIGYDGNSDSITFPVKDDRGNCLFIARRSVRSKYFDLPKDVTKPLYGLYEVCQKGLLVTAVGKVYVTEGLFDCLRLWCNGKYAVAGFGCLFNQLQIKQLQALPVRHLVLALDNDEAGREGAERIKRLVHNKLITQVVIPNGKKDIGELTDEEIQNLEEIF